MAKPAKGDGVGKESRDVPDSFDRWLDEGLHKLYDDVVKAPLPPALLALIENHRDGNDPAKVVMPPGDGHSQR